MPIVTVANPAADRRLCSIAALKTELGIDANDTQFDGWLEAESLSASDLVAITCGVAGDDAGDAPATFAEEVAIITFAAAEAEDTHDLLLPWRHPTRVTAVSVGGETLDPSLYWADPKAALVKRLSESGRSIPWRRCATAITVKSGWAAGKVPTPIQDAVKRLVRLRWEAKDRDSHGEGRRNRRHGAHRVVGWWHGGRRLRASG